MKMSKKWQMEWENENMQINFNYIVCLTNAESIKTLASKLKSSDTAR